MDIRLATAGDVTALTALIAGVRAEKLDTLTQRDPPVDGEIEAWLTLQLSRPRSFVLLAVLDGALIGMLDFQAGEHEATRHTGRFGVSVARLHRGQGVGRALCKAAIAQAKSWPDFCRIEIGCTPWNEAGLSLYRSLGFEIEGVRRKALNFRGVPEDDLLLALIW